MQLQTIIHTIPPLYDSESRVLLLGLDSKPEIPRGRVLLRPPAEPVLARAGGCAWRGGAGLHRGQARDVPAASCGAVGHHRQMRYCGRVRHVYPQRRAERHRPPLRREQNYAHFCPPAASRRSCTANSSSRKPACPCTQLALHQSRERRMVAPKRLIEAYRVIL